MLLEKPAWDRWLTEHKNYHILQTSQWASLKEKFGWTSQRFIHGDAGAQVLLRHFPLGLSIAYIPKGPIGKTSQAFWEQIDRLCKSKGAVFLKIEPDLWEQDSFETEEPALREFRPAQTIQPRRTIAIDLQGNEEIWLGRMKQKTRYNVKLAEKKDVFVRETDDINTFYEIMISTGNRDKFGIHSKEYYNEVFYQFHPTGNMKLFIAYFEEQPLAGVIVFCQGQRAWYFYGASNEIERNRMPAYLLQLHAMRWAAQQGCLSYDLWGIPDEEESVLERDFVTRSEALWGVYRFKRGFGGVVKRYHCAYDRVYHPVIYKLYQFYTARRAVL
jgi:lipid II:glycine glycyltransferase (peptidoglycan interpeptide bridge formation enzyme)